MALPIAAAILTYIASDKIHSIISPIHGMFYTKYQIASPSLDKEERMKSKAIYFFLSEHLNISGNVTNNELEFVVKSGRKLTPIKGYKYIEYSYQTLISLQIEVIEGENHLDFVYEICGYHAKERFDEMIRKYELTRDIIEMS